MFMVTKYGKPGLDILACQDVEGWWGKNDEVCPHNSTTGKWEIGTPVPENPLIELTETAHMILFFVMMLFLFGKKKNQRSYLWQRLHKLINAF